MSANETLIAACKNGDNASVEAAIARGADVDCVVDIWTPLRCAANFGHSATVRLLVSEGADVNKPNAQGFTPIYVAAMQGHADVVKTLAQLGADIDKRSANGFFWPILAAAQNGHAEVVATLVQLGAVATSRPFSAELPILAAACNGQSRCVHALVEAIAARDGSAAALELLNVGLESKAFKNTPAARALLAAAQEGEPCLCVHSRAFDSKI